MNEKKSKKRIIINVSSFFLIIFILATLIPFSYLSRPLGYNRRIIAGFYGEKSNSLDMVYIGGSACFVYWEPLRAWKDYGFTSYNFAHDSLVPQAIKYYMQEIKKTQDPSLFLVDLRPFQYGDMMVGDDLYMYHESYIRNGTDNLKYSSTRNELIKVSTKNRSFAEKLSFYWDYLKYYTQLLDGFSNFDYIDNAIENKLKGFEFIYKTALVEFTDYSNVSEELQLAEEIDDYFKDLLDYCKTGTSEVLFIVHSYCQTKQDKMKYNYMKRIINEYGFDFLNTNDYFNEINLDYSKDLYNENHVNIFGAEKYTDFVADYIINKYEFVDKRNDKKFSAWNDLLDNFECGVIDAKQRINNMIKNNTES